MKIHEILKEDEFDDSMDDGSSPHAGGNKDFATSDMAGREFMAIEQDPAAYYQQRGERLAPEQAQQISQVLSSVDDRTLDLMINSPLVNRAIEANYDGEGDSSYIDLQTLMTILGKVQARG